MEANTLLLQNLKDALRDKYTQESIWIDFKNTFTRLGLPGMVAAMSTKNPLTYSNFNF